MFNRSLGSIRKGAVLSVVALFAIFLVACGSDDSSDTDTTTTDSGETQSLSVVLFPTTDQAAFYEALNGGIFEENGLDVEAEQVLDATALTAAVTSGNADIMHQSLPTVVTARASGLPLQLVSGVSEMPAEGYAEIMVKEGSDIQSFADLEGTRVASAVLQGVFDLAARNAIQAEGGDPMNMEMIAMSPTDLISALERDRVDAIVINDPFLVEAQNAANFRSIGNPFSTYDYTLPSASAYATEDTIAEKGDALEAYKESLDQAAEQLGGDAAQAGEVVTSYTELTPDVVDLMTLPEYNTEVDAEGVNLVAEQMDEFGWIEQPVTGDELIWSGAGE